MTIFNNQTLRQIELDFLSRIVKSRNRKAFYEIKEFVLQTQKAQMRVIN